MNIAILGVERKLKKEFFNKRIDAYLRNALVIQKLLNADFLFNETEYLKHSKKKYDKIIFFYSNYYAPVNEMKMIVSNNPDADYFFILNEYQFPSGYRFIEDKKLTYIQNFEKEQKKFKTEVLNLNLLLARESNEFRPEQKKYDLIYYGTFRPDRSAYFKEYLQEHVHLSTSAKNFKKFVHLGCSCNFISSLSWQYKRETLNLFKYSLYIEDHFTHSVYNHLANRFYEALFCNAVQFFDRSAENTVRRSGIQFDDFYFVESRKELISKIDEINKKGTFKDHHAFQQQWNTEALQQRKQMLNDLKQIILK